MILAQLSLRTDLHAQLHSPDPAYIDTARARANFRLAVLTSLGFVALLWLIPLLGWGLELERFGIHPREWIGLPGILVAPLLHADFNHLLANSLPLLVLGTTIFHLYPYSAFRVLPAVYLGPGILVWLFARGGNHIGASGIVYGLVSFVFFAGTNPARPPGDGRVPSDGLHVRHAGLGRTADQSSACRGRRTSRRR